MSITVAVDVVMYRDAIPRGVTTTSSGAAPTRLLPDVNKPVRMIDASPVAAYGLPSPPLVWVSPPT
jgi:hypothetical protein